MLAELQVYELSEYNSFCIAHDTRTTYITIPESLFLEGHVVYLHLRRF